jgi:hypothetical protein
MRRHPLRIAAIAAVALTAVPAFAAETTVFGSARVKPTYYGNTDNDSDKEDVPLLNEGGFASGEHVRAEMRLGVSAKGENWRAKIIAEGDMIMEKDTADRSFYTDSLKEGRPNAGSEFGIERTEFAYTFAKGLELSTGWDIRSLDIKSGGLVFGDDHPFIGATGQLAENTKYEVLYLIIQNRALPATDAGYHAPVTGDWRAYSLKVDQSFAIPDGKLTISPFFAASANKAREANAYYLGAELTGTVGIISPSAEFAYVTGSFANDTDIASYAGYLGAEVALAKVFSPYVALRYTRGDDDAGDKDANGFVGITDIGRFSPLMGMDGNILGEHLHGTNIYGSPLYSFSPDRAVGGNLYGGISNVSSGNNPGQRLLAVGAKGDLSELVPNLSYKAQAFFIMYDETQNLLNQQSVNEQLARGVAPADVVAEKVSRYAATTADVQLRYKVSPNFAVEGLLSVLLPGAGIEDQIDASDPAMIGGLSFDWNF